MSGVRAKRIGSAAWPTEVTTTNKVKASMGRRSMEGILRGWASTGHERATESIVTPAASDFKRQVEGVDNPVTRAGHTFGRLIRPMRRALRIATPTRRVSEGGPRSRVGLV